MPWGVDKANAMRGNLQEFAARLFRLHDPRLALDAEVVLDTAALGDPFTQKSGIMTTAAARNCRFSAKFRFYGVVQVADY